MKLPTITQLAREQARFTHFEDGCLWYEVMWFETVDGIPEEHLFDFPVPVNDTDGGRFLPVDRGLYFMRWMRKHLAMLTAAVTETT